MHWDGNLRLACMLQYKLIPSFIILLYYISLYIIIVGDTCETVPEQLTIRPENAGLLRAIIFELILCLQDRMIPALEFISAICAVRIFDKIVTTEMLCNRMR